MRYLALGRWSICTAAFSRRPAAQRGSETFARWTRRSPSPTFGGVDLYPTLVEKATALCFSLVRSHPFVDGNKRVGHAAIETFLVLNGAELEAAVDDQDRLMLDLAAGRIDRARLTDWIRDHLRPLT